VSDECYTPLNVLRNHSIAPVMSQKEEGSKVHSAPGRASELCNLVAFAQGAA
jgi:hypothetical protein